MNRLIYCLMTLLGFGSVGCESEALVEYGVPSVTYEVKARVVDSEGNPIKGIEVIISQKEDFNPKWGRVFETTTLEDGTLAESRTSSFTGGNKLYIKLTDVDGAANGGDFEELVHSAPVYPLNKIEEGEGWYAGCYKVQFGDITLEPKSASEDESAEGQE